MLLLLSKVYNRKKKLKSRYLRTLAAQIKIASVANECFLCESFEVNGRGRAADVLGLKWIHH